ncbi:MAG: BMP family ABC transporter substrate-binding protein [Clostridia bacterium]|nr:BMP family ABC transporter substrate-binding protein [Clostridia bacterium]
MKKLVAVILTLVLALSLVACAAPAAEEAPAVEEAPAEEAVVEEAPAEEAVKIGVILVHDENSGYDMAHIEGIEAAKAALGLTDDQVIYKYNVPEDEKCYDNAVDLVEQGCSLVISNSYGHQSFMLQAAMEYPEVKFISSTGDMAGMQNLDNYGNIFPYTFQSRYVSGIVAGMKLKELMDAGTVSDPYVGYVGAYPYAEVVSGYTGFFLGMKSIVPDVHMDVMYTNSWYDPTAEAEAANALIGRGCVIIGQHADSTGAPSAVQAQLDGGKVCYSVGYNIDMLSVAPTAALTSAQNNWGALYTPVIEKFLADGTIPVDYAAGAADGAVMISALGESCAAGTQEAVDAAWAGLKDGSVNVFDTANFTVGGEVVTSAFALDTDGDWVNDTAEAIVDGIFQESVHRSAPYFGLRIDGITELS